MPPEVEVTESPGPQPSQKRRINRRAWLCAKDSYRRYRDELEEAIRCGAISADDIDAWQPTPKARCENRRQVDDRWIAAIDRWLASDSGKEAIAMNRNKITMLLILRRALNFESGRIDQHSIATRVGICMRKLGFRKREDKSLPDRFYYEKGQSGDQAETREMGRDVGQSENAP